MVLLVISWFLNFILISKTTLECHFERRTQSEVEKSVFEVCQISPLRSTGPPVEMTRCGCFCCVSGASSRFARCVRTGQMPGAEGEGDRRF